MNLITPTDLQTSLKLQGITIEDSDELEKLIDLKTNELISITGIPIKPVSRKQINPHFKGKLLELDYYPVLKIHSFKINGEYLKKGEDYIIDENPGIIYLNKPHKGLLVVEYIQQLPTEEILFKINPLISDMILYTYKNIDSQVEGVISSIHEADQSVSYDTSNSLGNRIYNRIESLKKSYKTASVRWL